MKDIQAAVIERLRGSSLRRLAMELYGDASKAGLLADAKHGRWEHISPATEQDLRRRLGMSYEVLHSVAVPGDCDAVAHILPDGHGELHTVIVPAGAEVVVVPAGARVVQAKPPSARPARKRVRVDITGLPLNAQEARAVLLAWLERYRADVITQGDELPR